MSEKKTKKLQQLLNLKHNKLSYNNFLFMAVLLIFAMAKSLNNNLSF